MSATLPQFHKPTFGEARINLLVWGPSGCGKTTLAATAPGLKAFAQFDNQGTTSIANREDFTLLDLSGASFRQTMLEFSKIDPFGLRAFLIANPDVQTMVIDSITTLSFQALQYAVTIAGGKSNIEVPGMNGYGTRNNVMRRAVQVIMQICSEQKKHLVVITHEAAPDKDEQGNTIEITMSLSSSLANDVSLRFNEVWHMQDTGRERLIYVRPHGVYKPCKSRMFADSKDPRFVWNYNADMLEGDGIADWFNQWQEGGGKKIPLPKK